MKTVKSGVKDVIINSVKHHGQFSRMDGWLRRGGPSKNNLLGIDMLVQEINGITEEDEEYDCENISELGS